MAWNLRLTCLAAAVAASGCSHRPPPADARNAQPYTLGFSEVGNALIVRVVPGRCPSVDECDSVVSGVPVAIASQALGTCEAYTDHGGDAVCEIDDEVLTALPPHSQVAVTVDGRSAGMITLQPLIQEAWGRRAQYLAQAPLAPPPPPVDETPVYEPPVYEPPPMVIPPSEEPQDSLPYDPPPLPLPDEPPASSSFGLMVDAALAELRQHPLACAAAMTVLIELSLNVSEDKLEEWLVQKEIVPEWIARGIVWLFRQRADMSSDQFIHYVCVGPQ